MDDSFSFGFGADSAIYLWPLAALVLCLAAHVTLGYIRHGARAQHLRLRLGCLGAGTLALGAGLWAAMLLGLSTGAAYTLGYSFWRLAAALAVALLTMAFALAWAVLRRLPQTVVLAGLLVGAGMLATQATLVMAAGLIPGAAWNVALLIIAFLMAPVGSAAGFWISLIGPGRDGLHRKRWRWMAVGLVAVAAVAGQELVMAAAAVSGQRGSIYVNQVPAAAACMLAGFAVPAMLLVMVADLRVRRAARDGVTAPRRQRRLRP